MSSKTSNNVLLSPPPLSLSHAFLNLITFLLNRKKKRNLHSKEFAPQYLLFELVLSFKENPALKYFSTRILVLQIT